MEQSYLIELARTLSPEEKEHVLQFAQLSFFNHGKFKKYVHPLLEYCLQSIQAEEAHRWDKKAIYAAVFPDQAFLEGKLEKAMVEANKVIRSFILTQRYFSEENEFDQWFDYAEAIRLRALENRYQPLLTRLQKLQAGRRWKNAEFYYHQFLLEDVLHFEACRHNQVKGDLNNANVLQALNLHYYTVCLARLNNFLLQQKAANLLVPDTIAAMIAEMKVPERYLDESPILNINFEIFCLLKKASPEPTDIGRLFDLLQRFEAHIDPENLQGFYAYLRNVCVLVIKSGQEHDALNTVLHDLYKDALARGYLHHQGKISPNTYLAVCNNALWVKNYDWTLSFLESNKHCIMGENETNDIYRFNKSIYLFAIGAYAKCLDHIPASTAFSNYLIIGKRLEMKALYELQSDLLSYRLDAFKMFLSRTSSKLLPEAQRNANLDFANLLHQLVNSNPLDPKRGAQLFKRLEQKKQASEWHWLMEKVSALYQKGGDNKTRQ